MARNRRGESEAEISRKLEEKRGSGHGRDYTPWYYATELSSRGKCSRPFGTKTRRVHHFLSDGERDYFLILDWSKKVVDIREQYPLLPRERTVEICGQLNISYPVDPHTRAVRVLTTDFLIDIEKNGQTHRIARSFKMANDLGDERTLEKLEIERRYWETQGIDWGIVTERHLPDVLVKNLEWLSRIYDLDDVVLSPQQIGEIQAVLEDPIRRHAGTLRNLCRDAEARLSLAPGTALTAVRHLLARRIWTVDMNRQIQPNQVLPVLVMTPSQYGTYDQQSRRVA